MGSHMQGMREALGLQLEGSIVIFDEVSSPASEDQDKHSATSCCLQVSCQCLCCILMHLGSSSSCCTVTAPALTQILSRISPPAQACPRSRVHGLTGVCLAGTQPGRCSEQCQQRPAHAQPGHSSTGPAGRLSATLWSPNEARQACWTVRMHMQHPRTRLCRHYVPACRSVTRWLPSCRQHHMASSMQDDVSI